MTTDEPSEAEIAEACRLIRLTWTEAETRRRSAWQVGEAWVAPVVDDDVIDAPGA